MQSAIVALCGVDGSGKSSLLRALQAKYADPDIKYVPSAATPTATLVERRARSYRRFGDSRDWIEGPFAQLVALACCFDFLQHYETHIQPFIASKKLIVCDRYSPCYMAYARLANVQPQTDALFSSVQPPTAVFYLDVPIGMLPERYALRGGPKELETTLFAERFSQSYEELLPALSTKVIRIPNSGPPETTVTTSLSHIREILTSTTGLPPNAFIDDRLDLP